MTKALKYRCDPCAPYKRQKNASAEEELVFCSTDDFKPCVFSHGDLKCELVPLSEIKKVVKKTATNRLKTVKITLQLSDHLIEEDIFANKRISNLVLAYEKKKFEEYLTWDDPDRTIKIFMEVHANAIRSSKSSMRSLEIETFDGSYLDLRFLTGFNQLNSLTFKDVIDIHHCLRTLPELPNLTLLDCQSCSKFGYVNWTSILVNGLKYTTFSPIDEFESDGDQTINDILNWLLMYSSDSLEHITIERFRSLTKVPYQISSFKSLKHLSLQNNAIETIGSGSLNFSAPVIYLDLQNNGIKLIEPDAFQGNFKKAYINVNNNKLNRFEASVFRRIVQEMDGGVVLANGNPIDCSDLQIRHLTWLICDENLKLENRIIEGTCSNGNSFRRLFLTRFQHC